MGNKRISNSFQKSGLAIAMAGALALTACGGGSGSSASSNANLSDAQKAYESFVLAQNGGQHYAEAAVYFTSSNGTNVVDPSTSYFFTDDYSLSQSPAAGPQMMTTGQSTLDSRFSIPTLSGERYLVNGTVVVEAVPEKIQVSYNGANIQSTVFAQDGKTAVETLLTTNYVTVPLSGSMANLPTELTSESNVGILLSLLKGQPVYNTAASWQSGAAYAKVTRQFVGDTVVVGDCAAPQTTGANVTPCATTATALEGFFPHASTEDGRTYNLGDGQIVTLAGVRAWVATVARGTPTTSYRIYYQNNGQIFGGSLMRDGTLLQVDTGGITPPGPYIFLNHAATQSILGAVTL